MEQQLRFITEIDRLKTVLRRNRLMDGSRRENSAEHSWHLAVMAVLLHEYANEAIDVTRVIKMLLVHDIVEVDADDTFCYDPVGMEDKKERERRAAERLFGLLPPDQAEELKELWQEFEQRRTPEARFAAALDRLQPALANHLTGGGTWREYGVTHEQVMERLTPIGDGSAVLWDYVRGFVERSVRRGDIRKE